jgi:hypothetical protein
MLKFPDGSQIRVNGLSEMLADLYSEGRQANQETAKEIMDRLEAKKNYIRSSTNSVESTLMSCRRSTESTLRIEPTKTGNVTGRKYIARRL